MLEKIAAILKEHKDDDSLVITEETTFEELGLDSLDTLQLVTQVEEEFDVTLEFTEPLKTVGELIEMIKSVM